MAEQQVLTGWLDASMTVTLEGIDKKIIA